MSDAPETEGPHVHEDGAARSIPAGPQEGHGTSPTLGCRPGPFPSTQWPLVRRAGEAEDGQDGCGALDELIRPYWPILKGYLIYRRGMSPEDAEDVLQSFLKAKFVERNLASLARPGYGRFRSFLLRSLTNYQVSWMRSVQSKGNLPNVCPGLQEAARLPLSAIEGDPDSVFDVEWARQVVHRALERMRQECQKRGQERVMEAFSLRVAQPLLTHTPPMSYAALMQRCGFASLIQVGNALASGRRLFDRALRDVIREYCSSEDEVDEEIGDLKQVLMRAGMAD